MSSIRTFPSFLAAAWIALLTWAAQPAAGHPEVMAWGNWTGIRVDGHLLEFGASMCVAQPDGVGMFCTGREKQTNSYSRNGKIETVTVQMRTPREFRDPQGHSWALSGKEVVEDTGTGSASIHVEFTSPEDADIGGAYFGVDLPAEVFSGGAVQLIDPAPPAPATASLAPGPAEQNEYLRASAGGALFVSRTRQIEFHFREPTEIIIRDDRRNNDYDLHVLFTVIHGKAAAWQTAAKSFSIKVRGDPDRNPVQITLDTSHPGQMFDGLGGNFRLQNSRTDPQVIDYALDNLRVAWGRVEMPWGVWQPEETADPLAAARAGTLNPRVQQAMEMARRLAQKGMPIIVSAWSAPVWAVLGAGGRGFGGGGRAGAAGRAEASPAQPAGRGRAGAPPVAGAAGAFAGGAVQPDGPRGNPLNPAKMAQITESLSSYLVYLKERYGVEPALFSFNESDLGINVRQTPREHNELIKNLGAVFASKGLAQCSGSVGNGESVPPLR